MSFTNLNEQFHIFSKSPVRAGQTLGSARNKSGHTVTTSDIWAEDIPALFYAYNTAQKDKFESIASDNDLCYDKEINKLYYFKSNSWIERNPLYDGEILFNSNAAKNSTFNDGEEKSENEKIKGVVQYHKEKYVEAITSSNNNESAGNGYTGRIKKSDGTYISQFVSSMDKLVSGNPSSYYEPIILNGSNVMEESSEDTTEKKYIANSYAGIIQFHQDDFTINNGNFVGIKASVFEYIGKKLDSTLSNISEDLNSDKSDRGVQVVQTNGKIESITVTPVTITNGSITNNGDNVISGNQVVTLINNAKTELLAAGVQYKVLAPSEQLPKASETYKGCIYLMPDSNRISGSYLEYMCVQKEDNSWTWEQIGTTKTDLNDYITNEEFEEHSLDNNIHITNVERTSWNNNTANTTNHINNNDIHVTNDEKSSWNNKIDSITGDDFINADDFIDTDGKLEITLSLNTTEEIIDSDVHVLTSAAVYKHTSDAEIHIPSASAEGSYNGAQTIEGESCHGFILNTNENTRIESIIILQTNKLGAAWNNNVYCKITDPITDREFISPKFEGSTWLPHSRIYFVKDGKKAEGVNEVPYLVKGRDYKLTFWSSDTHEPISINVPYIEPNKTPNAHFGKFITHRILLSGEVVECSYPDIAANNYGISTAFKAAGYTIIPVTRRCDNIHFIDVANEIANVYDALDTNEPNQDVTDHINNTDIHFSYKVLQEPSSSTSTFDNCDTSKCYVNTDSGQGDGVFAIEYSKAHFVPSTLIKKITIPYDNASSTGITSNNRNLVLEVFKNSNDVTPSNVFFSNNTDSYTNSKNEYSFTFDNLILPDDYAFVRISITSHISTDAEGNKTRTKYEKFRIIPLRVNGETNKGEEGNIFEIDDECKIYWNYSENTDTLSTQKNFVANFIAEYQTLILHKNNEERHITSSERTSWNNKISEIIEGDTIINCELNETSKSVTLSLKQDEVFKNSVCVCDIQSLEEDGKEYIIYDDSCSPKYISFAEKITNGESMFMNQLLKHFRINLHNMTNGKNMFMNCTLLQHFDSDLTSLTEAENMFGYCCLSLKSVKNIADKINTVTSGNLGQFGINIKYQNNEELNEALAILTSKGWSYNAQYRNL